ncbi:HK97 gp10 family phage protein [Neisseria weixii]|uniref:HK97 gp10 family phage protein n=1 Tax=Neisseria weixii TaxID=1853276 RepID=A0A3N4N5G6_9NEIS|nr:HK97 gp10 family phage protein [Neisseria weixii]RPD86273.1 HK97 gp10 family phage protein [Neisseria weixii]RPD89407.1 HK97 gp10 family phage protein [Neisseria weixii]
MVWVNEPDMFADLVEQEADKLYRSFAITCLNNIVMRSPVDTGRYRGSHVLSIGAPDYSQGEADKAGSMTLQAGIQTLKGVPVGKMPKVFIQTNLPYAMRIENGWSKQAAQGVYAVSFNNAVKAYK